MKTHHFNSDNYFNIDTYGDCIFISSTTKETPKRKLTQEQQYRKTKLARERYHKNKQLKNQQQ